MNLNKYYKILTIFLLYSIALSWEEDLIYFKLNKFWNTFLKKTLFKNKQLSYFPFSLKNDIWIVFNYVLYNPKGLFEVELLQAIFVIPMQVGFGFKFGVGYFIQVS